jgi:hypothetical protein
MPIRNVQGTDGGDSRIRETSRIFREIRTKALNLPAFSARCGGFAKACFFGERAAVAAGPKRRARCAVVFLPFL